MSEQRKTPQTNGGARPMSNAGRRALNKGLRPPHMLASNTKAAAPQFNRADAERFLAALDPAAERFTFQTFDDDKEREKKNKTAHQKKFPKKEYKSPYARIYHGSLASQWDTLARWNARGAGIFVTVNETDLRGRKATNIKRIRAGFADLDGAPLAPVLTDKVLPPPHIVVESSPGRCHPYWLVEGVELKEFATMQKALAAHFHGDKAVHDLPRVLRLPGFFHRKDPSKLIRVNIHSIKPGHPYKAADFLTKLAKAAPPEVKPQAALDQEENQWNALNTAALQNLAAWVPKLFPDAIPYHGGFRVSSASLGRDLEEDLSLVPKGIKDFGTHDLDDPRDGKRTPIDIVMQWKFAVTPEDIARREHTDEFQKAVDWLREQLPEPPQENVEPIDLWANFESPSLPRKLLPKVIEDYAFTQGETMGADPVGIAVAALAVCAGATPDSIKLQMKKHSSEWQECARIWAGLVGLPSTKKTPIMSAVIKTLMRLDGDLLRQFQFETQQYKDLTAEERKEKKPPMQKRLRLEDTTIEAAQEVLSGSPEGVLLHQDELSGWFGSMDKYSGNRGAAKDRGFWLQSYNGGPSTWNRIGRGVGFIPNLSISLLGGIQPDVIRRLAMESYDDGFLQRLLVILLRPAVMGKDVPTPAVADKYAKLIERLTELSPPTAFGNFAVPLSFDAEAQQLREELERKHLALMHLETVNRKLASHIGKYDGLFGRLCVLWHCIEHAHDKALPLVVSIATAKRVAGFIHRFLLRHAIAFYAGVLGLADDHDRLAAVAGYILAHKLERMTNRDIQRGDGTMRKLTRLDTEQVFEQLEALGWVARTQGPRGAYWIINPKVHTHFADRAVKEIERRAAARELILDKVRERRLREEGQ
jgi:Protein of unknown function (DUF3987)/RepB DNA-primase from phage plasmid